jgi:S-adenosylhomocysteine hydrolase
VRLRALLLLVLLLAPLGADAGYLSRSGASQKRLVRDRSSGGWNSAPSAFAPHAPASEPHRIDRVAEAVFSRELEPLLAAKAKQIRQLSRTRPGLYKLQNKPGDALDAALVEALTSSASERVGVRKIARIDGLLVGTIGRQEEARALRRQISSGEIAAALSQLIEKHTDGQGVVDLAGLEKRLGPSSRPLLRKLRSVAATGTREIGWAEQKLGVFGDYSLTERVGTMRFRDVQMGAFWKVVQRTRGARPLDDIELFGIQHLFTSTAELVKGFVAAGVDPYSIHLLGKAYSTNRTVHDAMQADGFMHSVLVGSTDANTGRTIENLIWTVQDLKPGRRLLVVDDGGELLKAINERLPAHLAKRVIGVEQTTRGVTVLSDQKLNFPVINVARSKAKQEVEAPLVGRAIVKALEQKLTVLGRKDKDEPILVLGHGTVGRATVKRLRAQGYTNIHIYDKSAEVRAAAAGDGVVVHETIEAALPHGHVVLGVTGHKDVVTAENAELLPENAILVNGASRATEFSQQLRGFAKRAFQLDQAMFNRFGKKQVRVGAAFDPARQDQVLRLPSGKELLLASSGHVINFTGEATDPIPPRYIQLTSGLLYLGALQAARTKAPGLHDLEEAPQAELLHEVESQLARTGESLKDPRF